MCCSSAREQSRRTAGVRAARHSPGHRPLLRVSESDQSGLRQCARVGLSSGRQSPPWTAAVAWPWVFLLRSWRFRRLNVEADDVASAAQRFRRLRHQPPEQGKHGLGGGQLLQVFDAANSSKSLQDGLAHGPGHPHQDQANLVMMPKAHRFSRSSYCASRRLYVAQRMRGGLGGKSYASSVVPPHLSCRRLAILRARVEAR
jgi:hypothetical protein